MDEKVKAVKKSAEALRTPLKFGKLTLLPLIGAVDPLGLRDADFFKAETFDSVVSMEIDVCRSMIHCFQSVSLSTLEIFQ